MANTLDSMLTAGCDDITILLHIWYTYTTHICSFTYLIITHIMFLREKVLQKINALPVGIFAVSLQ